MLPLMPAASVKFSVHSWAGVLKHLKQMLVSDAKLEDGMNWGIHEGRPGANTAVASVVILRGDHDVAEADVSAFLSPAMCVCSLFVPAFARAVV